VYGSGDNKSWQASGKDAKDYKEFTLIDNLQDDKIVKVACGGEFSMAVSEDGKLYAWGNPQYGQLGDGSDNGYIAGTNRFVYQPQIVKEISIPNFEGRSIVDISCGINHTFLLDDQGRIYAWGFAGFGRLGLNLSPPKDVMIPTPMQGFVERNNPVKKVVAGPSGGMLVDSRDALMLWGKWKNSGDGGQGTPWLYPKYYIIN
jgi:alpha-tubulin suppressor-like RCC1 family protein